MLIFQNPVLRDTVFLFSGLPEFFKKVDSSYYELHPYNVGKMKVGSLEFMRKLFKPYNPTPESIKAISDRSHSLLEELNGMQMNRKLLLARERRIIAQADHFLRHYFGRPYENNYMSGKIAFSLKVLPLCIEKNAKKKKLSC